MSNRMQIVAALAMLSCLQFAQPACAVLSDKDVESIVRSEKNWSDRGGLSVKIDASELTLGTYREPSATDKDLKIDSVMITRKIMEAAPEIARVKVRFYDASNRRSYEMIDVRQTDIKAFKEGLVTIDTLLQGINIQKMNEAPEVVPGPLETERTQAKQHIAKLRGEGVGVAAFQQLFGKCEELAESVEKDPNAADAETKKTEMHTTLDRLNKAFDDQAAFVKMQKEKALQRQLDEISKAKKTSSTATVATSKPSGSQGGPNVDIDPTTGLEILGSYTPTPGPYLLDRIYIGRKLMEMKKQNLPVTNFGPLWSRMEMAARKREAVTVKGEVDGLFKQLGMTPLTDADRAAKSIVKAPNY